MPLVLTQGERQHIASFEPEDRAEYCITQLLKHQEIFGLFGKDGWIMMEADEDVVLPVWPTAGFAEDWMGEQFEGVEAKSISFTDWFEKWLPGMEGNGTLILVCPVGDEEEGIILSPSEFIECLKTDDDSNE